MTNTYTTIKHPQSGETYAVEMTEDGLILNVAGPLHHSDATDDAALSGWISNNSDTSADDAVWLTEALRETGAHR